MTVRKGRDEPANQDDRPRDPIEVSGAVPFRVAVTRPDTGDDRFREALTAQDLHPVDHPLLRIAPPVDPAPLARLAVELAAGAASGEAAGEGAGEGAGEASGEEAGEAAGPPPPPPWLIVTSRQAIPPLQEALAHLDVGPAELRERGVRVAAVGSATAEALEAWGLPPDLVPDRFTGDDLLDTLVEACGRGDGSLAGERFFFPRAERAREALPEGLEARGGQVHLVTAYRIVPDPEGARSLWAAVEEGALEVVTFTSGSALRTLVAALPPGAVWPASVQVAVIGPVTAAAAEGTPVPVHLVPPESTLEALAAAVAQLLNPD